MPVFSAFEANFRLYSTPRAVKAYAGLSGMSPGEQAVLSALAAPPGGLEILEIGVGAGRLTGPLAAMSSRYAGIDVAPAMVDACAARYPRLEFQIADAARLEGFADACFDFVLFSFNGIDCLEVNERAMVFSEARRVLRPGGQFAFSSHNKAFLEPLGAGKWLELARRPSVAFRVGRRKLGLAKSRREAFADADEAHATVIENQFGVDVPIVYVDPAAQERELRAMGCAEVSLFSNITGERLDAADNLMRSADAWIYYLCRLAG